MEYRLSNIAPSPADDRDYPFVPVVKEFPAVIDLRPYVAEIEDQELEGSCTTNATCSAVELMLTRAGRFEDLSRNFLYWTVRDFENRANQDGAVLRDVMKVASKYGVCTEDKWPYLASNENTKPTDDSFADAATRKVTRYEAVEISRLSIWDTVANIKSALAEGLPVVVAMTVYEPFLRIKGPLAEQDYRSYDPVAGKYYPNIGNHAVSIVGFDDAIGGFLFANSWGASWGDGGYGLLKYSQIGDVFEAWVIRSFDGIDIAKPTLPAPAPQPDPTPTPQPTPDPQPEPTPEREHKLDALPIVLLGVALAFAAAKIAGIF
jgi:C1A family cysteine protease